MTDELLPRSLVRSKLHVCDKTLARWIDAGSMPKPIRIRGRDYWQAEEIAAWIESKRQKAA